MESSVVYFDDDYGTQAKYKNIYFIDNEFFFLTTDNTITLKPVYTHVKLTSKRYTFLPQLRFFLNENEMQLFLLKCNLMKLRGNTIFVSGYYDVHNMHFITDTLYSTYVTFLKTDHKWNEEFNVLYESPKEIGGISKHNMNVFKTFSKSDAFIFYDQIQNNNVVFDEFISGMHMHGSITLHKMGYLAEKDENTMQQYRDRFIEVYNIQKINDTINVIIVDNNDIHHIISELLNYVKQNFQNVNCRIVKWDNKSWREQLEIAYNTQVYITGPGSAAFNFMFMQDNSVKINLGRIYKGYDYLPNDCIFYSQVCVHIDYACRKYIYCDFFDLKKYKNYDVNEICRIINMNIKNLINDTIPTFKESIYLTNWRRYWANEFKGNEKQITKLFCDINQNCERKERYIEGNFILWIDMLEESKKFYEKYLYYT